MNSVAAPEHGEGSSDRRPTVARRRCSDGGASGLTQERMMCQSKCERISHFRKVEEMCCDLGSRAAILFTSRVLSFGSMSDRTRRGRDIFLHG